MQVAIGLGVVALVLALAAMSMHLLGMAVGHAPTLQFAAFYQGGGAQNLTLRYKLVALHGQRVVMAGFMAPPLMPGARLHCAHACPAGPVPLLCF